MMDEKRQPHNLRLIVTLSYTVLIFALLPVSPSIWGFFFRFYPGVLKELGYLLVFFLVVLFFAYFALIHRKKGPVFYVWSSALLLSYVPLVFFYCEYPAERFHLVEYGVLVICTYWCLKTRIQSFWIYLIVTCYACLIGLLDELIQGILPNRVYEFKDITINWVSSLVATGLLVGVTWERAKANKDILNESMKH
ncbi:MAG: VanZ family protein [Thermodesulfobacteriota bacterium]|nr:VanZ family protein [Thermodesulfobacteriota bacterium]